jgi:aminopeptidase N
MLLPLKVKLFGAETGRALVEERLVMLGDPAETIVFDGIAERPVLSINRGFSAPVVIESDRGVADLAFLSAHDDDPFARYEAMQQLMLDALVADAVEGDRSTHDAVIAAVARTLDDPALDPAFQAEAVLLPSESFIGDQMSVVDPDAIFRAREGLRRALGERLAERWRAAYDGAREPYAYTPEAKGRRRLRNVALGFLAAAGGNGADKLAFTQFEAADNMTDRMGALTVLANGKSGSRDAALAGFYARHRDNGLVIDKWFQVQALSSRDDTGAAVAELARHPDFTLSNPNRVRALVGAFGVNQRAFNAADGSGYRFLADQLLRLDPLNPQTAAKLLPPLARWRRFDAGRAELMRAELERIVGTAGLSKDLFEQASKSLEG